MRLIDFISSFTPTPKVKEFNVKLTPPEDLWLLKSLVRCYLKNLRTREDERYVFGSAKKSLSFMSRVLFNYEKGKLKVLCLLEDEKVCNHVFEAVNEVVNRARRGEVLDFSSEFVKEIFNTCKKRRSR